MSEKSSFESPCILFIDQSLIIRVCKVFIYHKGSYSPLPYPLNISNLKMLANLRGIRQFMQGILQGIIYLQYVGMISQQIICISVEKYLDLEEDTADWKTSLRLSRLLIYSLKQQSICMRYTSANPCVKYIAITTTCSTELRNTCGLIMRQFAQDMSYRMH